MRRSDREVVGEFGAADRREDKEEWQDGGMERMDMGVKQCGTGCLWEMRKEEGKKDGFVLRCGFVLFPRRVGIGDGDGGETDACYGIAVRCMRELYF